MDNFDPYNVLLAIATNIPVLLMTAFVLQGHIVLAPLADTFARFKQKLKKCWSFFFLENKTHFTCQVNASWFKNV